MPKPKTNSTAIAGSSPVPCSACDGTTLVRCKTYGWSPCQKCAPKNPDQAQWEAMVKPIFKLMKSKGIGAMTLTRDGNKGSFSLIPEQNDQVEARRK